MTTTTLDLRALDGLDTARRLAPHAGRHAVLLHESGRTSTRYADQLGRPTARLDHLGRPRWSVQMDSGSMKHGPSTVTLGRLAAAVILDHAATGDEVRAAVAAARVALGLPTPPPECAECGESLAIDAATGQWGTISLPNRWQWSPLQCDALASECGADCEHDHHHRPAHSY